MAYKTEVSVYYDTFLTMIEEQGYTVSQTSLQDGLKSVIQTLMDIEVSRILDASRYERSTSRRAYRNGYRTMIWNSSVGNIELGIPKLRRGTYYPDRLLNDLQVSDLLVQLVKVCILQGIDDEFVNNMLATLDWLTLSAYEVHQVCDALRLQFEQSKSIAESVKIDFVPTEQLSLSQRKYFWLLRQQNGDGQREFATIAETAQLDHEFWHDFARRMALAGLEVEDYQSVLSRVNPYALLRHDPVQSAFQPDFVKHIYTLYEEPFQLTA